MKTLSFSIITLIITLLISSCELDEQFANTDNAPQNTTDDYALSKESSTEAIVITNTVTGGNTTLRIKNREYNDAEFSLHANQVADGTVMKLTKRNKASNRYLLEPLQLQLGNQGLDIVLAYDHSALPSGVTENDLQVFYKDDSGLYYALDSRVKKSHKEVYAIASQTGEFVLGATDPNSIFHIVEGEFGLRTDDWINPKRGGKINLPGGSYIEIPANALDQRTEIGMIAERDVIFGKSEAKVFTFTPHGTVFNTPIKLNMNWKEFAGEKVILYYFNEESGDWDVYSQGIWDERNFQVTLEIPHFSRYAVAYGR